MAPKTLYKVLTVILLLLYPVMMGFAFANDIPQAFLIFITMIAISVKLMHLLTKF